jgi:hypothetical protein
MLSPVMQYTGGGINPLYDNDWGIDNIAIAGGSMYKAGQCMGLVPGTGTAVAEVQTITITGTPTGGTFTLIYGGYLITAPIAYNATAAQVVAAINAAAGATVVSATGGPLPGTAVVLTFINEAGAMAHSLLIAVNNLTGGASPAVTPTRTTAGKPAGGYFKNYDDAASDGSQTMRRILKFDVSIDILGNVTAGQGNMGGFGGVANRAVPAFYKGYFRCSDLIGLDANGVTDVGKLINAAAYTESQAVLCMTGA